MSYNCVSIRIYDGVKAAFTHESPKKQVKEYHEDLQSQSLFRISTARLWSSLKEADTKTFSWLDAISLSSASFAPLPTPIA